MNVAVIYNNIVTSGIDHFEDSELELKYKLINTFALVSLIGCTVSLLYTNPFAFIAIINYFAMAVSAGIIIFLRKTKNLSLITTIDFIFTLLAVWVSVYSGGQHGVSLIWICIQPPVYYFFTNNRTGAIWSWISLLGVWVMLLLHQIFNLQFAYDFDQIAEATIAYIFILLMMYIYSNLIESKQQRIKVSNASLNDQLLEVKKLNEVMIGRELKMTEMKKEIEELKSKMNSI